MTQISFGLAASVLAMAAMLSGAGTASARTFVYVSAATAGAIDTYSMDEKTGALLQVSTFNAGKMVMPMTVSADKKHLYAVIRSQPYRVLTLAIDPATGKLSQEAVAALPDSMPYVSTDPSGRLLFAASYGGNKIAVLPIGRDGLVTDGARQMILTGRNAHSIVSDRTGGYVFATNLGSDAVLQFVLDPETGMLEANDPAKVATKPGFGPRHIIVSPDNKSVYILTELTGHVIHYALDAAKGTLSEVESVKSVPDDAGLFPGIAPPAPAAFNATAPVATPADDGKPKVWAADIGITPNGKFLYTTERTTSRIALFQVAAGDGKLTYVTNYPTEQQPRGIRIDPSGRFLVASGEKSDRLAVYAIDQASGALTPAGRYPVDAGANWIEIVTLP
ncbi:MULTISPECIES: lactonase family protein [unclassified Rhizobium]|uniref:lactonase family protein n=1 Tax=unclassified Rhizobium TaxID=2613769 RepID=UPI000EA9EC3A|nr:MULTISPECIES: lactonase family protein [unclassified Rhizobium]AYG68824.1 lactonase family protein [Rhizobium sp. CCGE531]AYG75210.1 lactonase family protein [Rhizobium sp. CCGE532]